MIESASRKDGFAITSVLGFVTLLLGASGVFVELKNVFDTIWKPERKASGLTLMLRARLTAIALVLAVGFLAIVSLLLSAALAGASTYLSARFPGASALIAVLDLVTSTLVLTVAFAGLIYFLSSAGNPTASAMDRRLHQCGLVLYR